jgi:hypothetical protein
MAYRRFLIITGIFLVIFLILAIVFAVSADAAEPTQDEITLTSRVVWGEARGEAYVGKVAVAEVIRNRADDKGISVRAVVTTKAQFCIGSKWNDECRAATLEAFAGSRYVQDALWFVSPANAGTSWIQHPGTPEGEDHRVPSFLLSARYVTTICGHDFYAPLNDTVSRGDTSVRVMRLGSSGGIVRSLQESLDKLGYHLDVDGVYGQATVKAVQEFQEDHGLAVDGIAGPVTVAAVELEK